MLGVDQGSTLQMHGHWVSMLPSMLSLQWQLQISLLQAPSSPPAAVFFLSCFFGLGQDFKNTKLKDEQYHVHKDMNARLVTKVHIVLVFMYASAAFHCLCGRILRHGMLNGWGHDDAVSTVLHLFTTATTSTLIDLVWL